MIHQELNGILQNSQAYFERSVSGLKEEHSTFMPAKDMFTTAQVIAHTAFTIDWFIEGAFDRAEGFSMDFEAHERDARAVTSLTEAMAKLTQSFDAARAKIAAQSEEALHSPLPQGPIMGGLPRMTIVAGIQEHTAHHRGALTVYALLVGIVPPMPYM